MQAMRSGSTPPRRITSPSHGEDLRGLADQELDRRIAAGFEVWSGIQDALMATSGMPPSRKLAAQVIDYFEGSYWRAEEARVEAVRRHCSRVRDRSVGRTRPGWSLT